MENGQFLQPADKPARARGDIQEIADRLSTARTKGELGLILIHEMRVYSMFDLQIIGGRLNNEIDKLPSPYRERIRPYFREQLFGKHHQLLAMHHNKAFAGMTVQSGIPRRLKNSAQCFLKVFFPGRIQANATRISGIRRTVSSIT